MSKDLVVYYSLEGNTEYVAEKIKENLGADLLSSVRLFEPTLCRLFEADFATK